MENKNEYSEDVQKILGSSLNPLIKYGLLLFILIIVTAMLCLYFIEYPDTYQVKVKILSTAEEKNISYMAYAEIPEESMPLLQKEQPIPIIVDQNSKDEREQLIGHLDTIIKSKISFSYTICIRLSADKLHSFIGKKNECSPEMQGIAIIEGDKKNFIQRIFANN